MQGDDGRTPIAAGATPIAESAVDADPATALLKPSGRSAFNSPVSARPRQRLPSIGEYGHDVLKTCIQEVDTPEADKPPKAPEMQMRSQHSRSASREGKMSVGLVVPRASTASPQMMRESRKHDPANQALPPPSPSPNSLAALAQAGRTSRNGPRKRIPDGINLHIGPIDHAGNAEITSPEPSVASSTRFHWPKRRGPGSVASSVTSASTTGRGHRQRTVGKSLDDYIHSLDAATQKQRQRSRHGSRDRSSRDRSRTRAGESSRASSQDRGRSDSRGWAPKSRGSPTSPIPMSPEDLISLETPRQADSGALGAQSIISVETEPRTVRKSSSVVRHKISSRASSRTRHTSPDRRPPMLGIQGREGGVGEGSIARPPSSPLPMSATTPHFQGSEDEEDYRRALEDQERFRSRHNRSTSRSTKDPTSSIETKCRDHSQGRMFQDRNTPENGMGETLASSELAARVREVVGAVRNDRQQKKEAAARELEERRQSLARRPSAPPIPHPDMLSPATYRNPMSFDSFVPPADIPTRSQSAQPGAVRGMQAPRESGTVMRLPATPKAMRLKFGSDMKSAPSIPPLPDSAYLKTDEEGSRSQSPPKHSPKEAQETAEEPSLVTLLPSTVYSPPKRNNPPPIPRCMSAPIPDNEEKSGLKRRKSTKKNEEMQNVRQITGISGNLASLNEEIALPPPPPPPPPPPAPPVLKELQHLAVPPPPPPAPMPGVASHKPVVYGTDKGFIEIVMDEDERVQSPQPENVSIPAAAPISEQVVPILSPPAPPSSRDNHRGRISRASERLRSISRPRNTNSAAGGTLSREFAAPYESIPPPMQYTGPPNNRELSLDRHPREFKPRHAQKDSRTGLLESEMI